MVGEMRIPLENTDEDFLSQLSYALTFTSEQIASYSVVDSGAALEVVLREGADEKGVRAKVEEMIKRYARREFGMKQVVHFEQRRDLTPIDAWQELLDRRWATQVGEGHVILRGPAAQLMDVINAKVESMFVKHFDTQLEFYPATIRCATLDRCHHFDSFPQHIDFVAHLRGDTELLQHFSSTCKEEGWAPELHEGRMHEIQYALSPSCCYHCYEGMEGWELDMPGRCITMTLECHRYEGANLTTLSRLRSFTMRELVWVGHPKFVTDSRFEAERLIIDWAKAWDVDCTFENSNDMFFSDDYAVKASFQRQQEAKRELTLRLPQEDKSIAVFSSNFHATTFGKAFDIKIKGRPAASSCIGWGYQRWVYSIFSQFGFDFAK